MTAGRATFRNPVYAGYFADPYVIRANGRWWAVGTGGGDVVTGLVSDDLVAWEPWTPKVSSSEPHLDGRTHAWAPELTHGKDRFHLYLSAGVEDRQHQIFVADADSPDDPYVAIVDQAKVISSQQLTGSPGPNPSSLKALLTFIPTAATGPRRPRSTSPTMTAAWLSASRSSTSLNPAPAGVGNCHCGSLLPVRLRWERHRAPR